MIIEALFTFRINDGVVEQTRSIIVERPKRKSLRMNEHRNREMRTFHRRQFIWAADKAAHFHAIVERRMRERDFDAVKHYQIIRAYWGVEARLHRERYDAVGK